MNQPMGDCSFGDIDDSFVSYFADIRTSSVCFDSFKSPESNGKRESDKEESDQ